MKNRNEKILSLNFQSTLVTEFRKSSAYLSYICNEVDSRNNKKIPSCIFGYTLSATTGMVTIFCCVPVFHPLACKEEKKKSSNYNVIGIPSPACVNIAIYPWHFSNQIVVFVRLMKSEKFERFWEREK